MPAAGFTMETLPKTLLSAALTTVSLFVSPTVRADEKIQEVTLSPDDTGLKFAQTAFETKAGTTVKITFINKSPVPQPHNLLVIMPGSINEVGAMGGAMLTDPKAMERSYIPESDKMLFAMKLVQPGETGTLDFVAPETPGKYPYICTFPGHWMTMRGVMTVRPK